LAGLAYAEGPAASPSVAPARVVISEIGLDSAVVAVKRKPIVLEGKTYFTWETADNEVGWHNLSAPPGQPGNTVLTGHSDIKAQIFRNLKDIEIGDEVQLFTANSSQPYRYEVKQMILVQEKGAPVADRIKNGQWISPTEDERLTLVTCAYPGATHRLIVVAWPMGEES
jgi:sortase A